MPEPVLSDEPRLSPADIQAVYAAGPQAVMDLVDQLQTTICGLILRVKELEDRLAQDSHNSSKPPSSDPPFKKTQSLRPKSGRKPGGQPGHPGRTLCLSETPDRVLVHAPTQCLACGQTLEQAAVTGVQRRQVVDLPPLALEVVEHQAQAKRCLCCGATTVAAFPREAPRSVQYGARIQALGVYLMSYQLLPYQRSQQILEDLFGAAPSEGTLYQALATCHAHLAQAEALIKQGLQQAKVAHFDESGMQIKGELCWVHVASTRWLTCYGWHAKRGRAGMSALGILPQFRGRALHDGWTSYLGYDCEHALCNAHPLRELIYVHERLGQAWAGQLATLLGTIKETVEQAQAEGEARLDAEVLEGFEQQYNALLGEGRAANPPPEVKEGAKKRGRQKQSKAQNLLDRLSQHRDETLAFMYHFQVPFDNNLAERDLRMLKVQQKISGGFRSEAGADYFCRIRGYLSTIRKQAQPVLETLQRAFCGHPFLPALSPE